MRCILRVMCCPFFDTISYAMRVLDLPNQVCASSYLETIPVKQLIMVTEMAAEKCKPGESQMQLLDFLREFLSL